VIASFLDGDPSVDCGFLELLVLADTRETAVKRARSIGLHGVRLRSPGGISDEDAGALLSSGRDAIWRRQSDPPDVWRTVEEWPIPPR
jgi:hypothetical protein